MMRGTPANAAGTPDAIANAAVYLASDESLFVHGTVIDVDGGRIGDSDGAVSGYLPSSSADPARHHAPQTPAREPFRPSTTRFSGRGLRVA
jgi:Enoyl-(Acyl carrier protein) reductase